MTTAGHQQNGQHCGGANGNQGAQKPAPVGTVVRSMCQTWFTRLAVTTRSREILASDGIGRGDSLTVRCKTVAPDLRVRRTRVHAVETSDSEVRRYGSGAFEGFCTGLLRIRPTVAVPRCRPARHSISASLTLPKLGHRALRRCTA